MSIIQNDAVILKTFTLAAPSYPLPATFPLQAHPRMLTRHFGPIWVRPMRCEGEPHCEIPAQNVYGSSRDIVDVLAPAKSFRAETGEWTVPPTCHFAELKKFHRPRKDR